MIRKTTRSILSVLLAALLLVTSIPLTPAFADGGAVSPQSANNESRELEQDRDGTYLIYTAENLKEFADIVNGTHAEGINQNTSANAKLMNDIDLNGSEENPWTPIGNSSQQYSGTFDGDGHTISGLYINNSRANDQGLFGYVSGGTVKDLSVSGDISGHWFVGGVVGYNSSGTVTGCIFSGSGSVSGGEDVGGVVGYNGTDATVSNCYNTGTVTGTVDSVGGVVGWNSSSGTVTNCYNTGAVSGGVDVGGVVGWNSSSGTVENCYNTGTVTGTYDSVGGVGGVVGYNDGPVKNCYNTGAVSDGVDVGGVVGYNISGSVTGCYFLQQGELPGIGDGSGTAGATGLTADEFADQNKFSSWTDFTDTWEIEPIFGRPTLKANAEIGGTANNPYKIFTATQLKNFATAVNDGGEKSAHAKLMNDIDLSSVCGAELSNGTSWEPIGTSEEKAYTGTFNGQNFKISGLYIDSSDTDYQGLFGYLGTSGDNKGTVQNLTVSGNVSGGWHVGGVVGYNNGGTVTGCIFSGSGSVSVTGSYYVGGVVGDNRGTVENCYNTGTVTGTDDYVGGVVGYSSGDISASASVTNCYNTGAVSGGEDVGGVVGHNSSDVGDNSSNVENCYNTGKVTGSSSVGGVVGDNSSNGNVENCYNTGNVSGGSKGGIVGLNINGSITGCYFLKTADVNKNLSGIGFGGEGQEAIQKTADAFHSGEVAYLLGEAWGQSALGTKDSWPTLVALDKANARKVYQLTFKYGYEDAPADEISYTNGSVEFPTFERTGYTFAGWTPTGTTISQDTTFTAQWTANTYTVTLDPNDGTIAEDQNVTTYTYGIGAALPTTVTREGYTFAGWYEKEDFTGDPVAAIGKDAMGDKTYWAKWEEVENPEPEPTPTPTPTPDPTPSGPSTDGSSGWDDILDELENAENGDEITIDMGDETKVPAEIFESLAGKDVDVTFDLGDVQWSVNGADIPTDTDFTDLDLGVNLDTSGIPVNVINTITGEVGTVQMTLAHDGDFGFTMTLSAPLGKENAGYWANLYHYDESAEAMNFEAAAKIDEDGSVAIPFSHASQYAIVIDTHSHATIDLPFSDVSADDWFYDPVVWIYNEGLMTGVSATEFAPEQTTTRAMIVSILARLENVTSAEAAGFNDVNDNDWYATAVNWAANVGVVNGYEDNTFQPNTAITREQLAAILMNYAAYKGEDVSARADLSHYSDADSISSWANDVLLWAVAEGLLTGVTDDTIAPQAHATRAQVAAILQRFLSE